MKLEALTWERTEMTKHVILDKNTTISRSFIVAESYQSYISRQSLIIHSLQAHMVKKRRSSDLSKSCEFHTQICNWRILNTA